MVTEVEVNRWILRYLNQTYKYLSLNEITVSEVCSCLRKAYYARTKVQQLTPTEFIKVVGNNIHQAFQCVLKNEGWDTEVSVSINLPGFTLCGRVDAVKDCVVIEFKSANEIPQTPYTSHQLQIQAYLSMLNAERGYIVYLSRTDGRVRVFKVHPDRQALKLIIERAKQLYEALKSRNPPPRENTPLCNHCEFQLNCWSGGDGVKR